MSRASAGDVCSDEVLSNDAFFMHNEILTDARDTQEPQQPFQGPQQATQEPGWQLSFQEPAESAPREQTPPAEGAVLVGAPFIFLRKR